MTTFMKKLFWSATAGLTMFVFLPQAKAQGRGGMRMGGRQMMMNSNMMGRMMTPNMMTPNMMTPSVLAGRMMNGGMTNGGMMNGGTMNGGMMNGGMMGGHTMTGGTMTGTMTGMTTGNMGTPFNFPNGFGGFGNQGLGFSGNGLAGSGFGGWGGYGGGYGLGGYGMDSLYPNAYAPTESSSTSRRKSPKRESIPTVTPEQERQRIHEEELAWSRSELPESATTSANALNILLTDLQGFQTQKTKIPDVAIDPAILASINVVVSGNNGNVGALKHNGEIQWPATLRSPEFDSDRQRVDASLRKAIDNAINANAMDLHDVNRALATIHSRLASKIEEISAPEYIRAKRLLDELDDAVKVLGQPDAGNYFNQTYTAQGRTVAQLVQSMTRRDLRFAPAVPGDEAAYLVLQRALAEYDRAVRSQLGSAVAKK
jgi:hypothetical protein